MLTRRAKAYSSSGTVV